MSTSAMRHFAAAGSKASAARTEDGQVRTTSRTDHLIAASDVGASDSVLVFGYEILDHLTGLARSGVSAATGVHAGHPYRPHVPVDIVWFTDVTDIDAEVTRLLPGIGNPRKVAIELVDPVNFGSLRRLLRCLRAKGLSITDYYKAAGLFVVTARQPRPVPAARRGNDSLLRSV